MRADSDVPVDASLGPAVIASRYRLERELGRGGAAIVWLAHDEAEDKAVAVKILQDEIAHSVASDRFLEEIRIVTDLAHPRLLPILDSGEWGGTLYYVTPYIESGSLRARLEREHQLPIGDALAIARDVADALEYAHRHGVIHRDVKPENILLSGDRAVVADFGIARALTRAAGDRITSTGIAVGTPAYMSPEQAAGNRDLDDRTDIYSLGCVLYEIIAGVMPFVGPTPESLIAQRFLHAPHPLHDYRATVPAHVETAIERAMAMRPADRFRTMNEFADALADSARASEARGASYGRQSYARSAVIVGAVLAALIGSAAVALTAYRRASEGVAALQADTTRWLVAAPVVGVGGMTRVDAQRQLTDAVGRWRDLSVSSAPDGADVGSVAKSAHTGRVVLSTLAAVGDSVELSASLVGLEGDTLRRYSGRALRVDAARVARLYAEASAALTSDARFVNEPDLAAALATDRSSAWRAYSRARDALANWNLAAAIGDLRIAVTRDPNYAQAQLWLAQALAWAQPDSVFRWRSEAVRAGVLAPRLPTNDSLLAAAVAHLALGRNPDACTAYRRLLAVERRTAVGWLGLGQCQATDVIVVRDPASPSGWSFRGSYESALAAYDSAVAHATGAPAFAFNAMRQLLIVEPFRFRSGRAGAPDTLTFSAHPSLSADTLAFVPHPTEAMRVARPSTIPSTFAAALQHNADRLRARMYEWVRRLPADPDALSALAYAQEVRGEPDTTDSGGLAALLTLRSSLRATPDTLQRLVLGAAIVRVLVKEERYAEAHALADSLLKAHPHPTAGQAVRLAGLAALVGALEPAEHLLALAESNPADATASSPPPTVSQATARLTVAAALGLCAPDLPVLIRDVETQIDRYVPPENRAATRSAMLARPLSLAVPCLGASPLATVSSGSDPLGAMQLAFGRRDISAVRANFAALTRLRRGYRVGDVALDNTFQEAWLLQSIGDSAAAERHLCVPISALPTLGTRLVRDVPQAAAIGRSLAFCARAAASRGDLSSARRWARALTALWATGDKRLQFIVADVRQLATAPP